MSKERVIKFSKVVIAWIKPETLIAKVIKPKRRFYETIYMKAR